MMRFSWMLVLLAVTASGCSEAGAAKVSGRVKLDGKALADAEVRFCPKDDPNQIGNSARTRADGTFELEPDPRTGRILPVGTYVILISKVVEKHGALPPAEDATMLLAAGALHNSLPHKYDDFEKSPFKVEIQKGENVLAPFELKSH